MSHAVSDREPSMWKPVLTGLAGASIEWYDFFLYGVAAALVFPALYFPNTLPPAVAMLASFSTFAVGFFARPVGAMLFGHFGDRAGRKSALVAALVLMGMATTVIGCLPSYATIGPWAPALLVLCRFLQGLAIGGQWGGAMLLIVESAPPHRRGYYGSFTQVGAPAGVVLANLAFLIMSALTSREAFLAWGWRVPFLSSVVRVVLAAWVHQRVAETPAFAALRAAPASAVVRTRSPILEVLSTQPRKILLAAGAFLAVQVSFYISITFVVAYASKLSGLAIPERTMLTGVLISSAVMAPALVWCGALSDRFGRQTIYRAGSLLMAAWAFVMFPLIETGSLLWITVAVTVSLTLNGMMYGPQAVLFSELFATRVRYSGASLGYQLGAMCGGGLSPLIATWLYGRYHGTVAISAYMAAACLTTFVCVALLGRTAPPAADAA